MILAFLVATIIVQPGGPVKTLTDALALARPGDRIVVRAGVYREPRILVAIPVEIVGEGRPVFEGGTHATLEVTADGVTLRGLVFRHVTPSGTEDRAAILLNGASNCVVEDNDIEAAFFGIYAMRSADCLIARNRIVGTSRRESSSGNGIHLWRSERMRVEHNAIRGQRDGIYFEFVRQAVVDDNVSESNLRYGLHFMRSDSCTYERNLFFRNGSGVAVMYSGGVRILENRFVRNWGPAAYGLLLKEISDGIVQGNRFEGNTVGLYFDDANRNQVRGNDFTANGWAVKVLANASDNVFEGNLFRGNSFDVATNSRSTSSRFRGNWWDQYRGYDLDRDGIGDVPYHPVRLFSLVIEQHGPAILLLRSSFVALLDGAERLLPMLTPESLVDARPLMAPPR